MYTEKAIERLNNIDWKNIGQNGHIAPSIPFMTDVSSFFEDCDIDDTVLNHCNNDLRNVIENPTLSTAIVNYYIKASMLSDKSFQYAVCMNVYDPIIRLFEKGGNFVYRERGMSFINSGLIPLTNWFENFIT